MLIDLREENLPAVEPVGVATWTGGEAGRRAILVTRYLDYSLPYHYLLARRGRPGLLDRASSTAARCSWPGSTSRASTGATFALTNALFRRDAGAFVVYLVDAETGEHRPSLSDAMRANGVEVGVENIAGGLVDRRVSR
jgi:hypothetical protein